MAFRATATATLLLGLACPSFAKNTKQVVDLSKHDTTAFCRFHEGVFAVHNRVRCAACVCACVRCVRVRCSCGAASVFYEEVTPPWFYRAP